MLNVDHVIRFTRLHMKTFELLDVYLISWGRRALRKRILFCA